MRIPVSLYADYRSGGTRYYIDNQEINLGIAAPADAEYVVLTLNGVLTDERVLSATSPLVITDGGAGGNVTVEFSNQTANTVLAGPATGAPAAPTFRALVAADLPGGFGGFANPTAQVGLSAVNGVATTAMRSDAAPALDQGITPTWTGQHTFNNSIVMADDVWIGAGSSDVRFIFDTTPATHQIRLAGTAGSGVAALALGALGNLLVLDADYDTAVRCSGDDTVDVVVAGVTRFQITENTLYLNDNLGATQLQIRNWGDTTATGADIYAESQGSFAADFNIWMFIDADNDSANAYFAIGKDDETSTGATELFRVNEGGYVGVGESSPTTMLELAETMTLTANRADRYSAGITMDPAYQDDGGGPYTLDRHNYIELDQPSGSSVTITDACVFRFNAAVGTHLAIDGATTKTTPGSVQAWMKINVNGNLLYVPAYTSKTA